MGIFGGASLIKGVIDKADLVEIKHSGINEKGVELTLRFAAETNKSVVFQAKFAKQFLDKLGRNPIEKSKKLVGRRIQKVAEEQQRDNEKFVAETDQKKKKKFEAMRKKREEILKDLNLQLQKLNKNDARSIIQAFVGRKLRLVIS